MFASLVYLMEVWDLCWVIHIAISIDVHPYHGVSLSWDSTKSHKLVEKYLILWCNSVRIHSGVPVDEQTDSKCYFGSKIFIGRLPSTTT